MKGRILFQIEETLSGDADPIWEDFPLLGKRLSKRPPFHSIHREEK